MDQVVLGLVFVMIFVLSDIVMSMVSPSYYEIATLWCTGGSDWKEYVRMGFVTGTPMAVCWLAPDAVLWLLVLNVSLLPLIYLAFNWLDKKSREHQTLQDISRGINEDIQRKLLSSRN